MENTNTNMYINNDDDDGDDNEQQRNANQLKIYAQWSWWDEEVCHQKDVYARQSWKITHYELSYTAIHNSWSLSKKKKKKDVTSFLISIENNYGSVEQRKDSLWRINNNSNNNKKEIERKIEKKGFFFAFSWEAKTNWHKEPFLLCVSCSMILSLNRPNLSNSDAKTKPVYTFEMEERTEI